MMLSFWCFVAHRVCFNGDKNTKKEKPEDEEEQDDDDKRKRKEAENFR